MRYRKPVVVLSDNVLQPALLDLPVEDLSNAVAMYERATRRV